MGEKPMRPVRFANNLLTHFLVAAALIMAQPAAAGTWQAKVAEAELSTGDIEKAISLFEQAASLAREEGASLVSVAEIYESLSDAYRAASKYPQALAALETAIELKTKALGPAAPELATAFDRKADLLFATDRTTSKRLFEFALKLRRDAYGPDHPALARSYYLLGSFEEGEGRIDEARALYLKALKLVEGSGSSDEATTLSLLSQLERQQGHPELADNYSRRAGVLLEHEGNLEKANVAPPPKPR